MKQASYRLTVASTSVLMILLSKRAWTDSCRCCRHRQHLCNSRMHCYVTICVHVPEHCIVVLSTVSFCCNSRCQTLILTEASTLIVPMLTTKTSVSCMLTKCNKLSPMHVRMAVELLHFLLSRCRAVLDKWSFLLVT